MKVNPKSRVIGMRPSILLEDPKLQHTKPGSTPCVCLSSLQESFHKEAHLEPSLGESAHYFGCIDTQHFCLSHAPSLLIFPAPENKGVLMESPKQGGLKGVTQIGGPNGVTQTRGS